MGSEGLRHLAEGLKKCKKIKILNLAKNNLTDVSSGALATIIISSRSLDELILHWNFLGPNCGAMIAKSLLTNFFVKVIDISYNAIGGHESENCFRLWYWWAGESFLQRSDVFKLTSCELRHLDFSYNQITRVNIDIFWPAFQQNNTIFGFHL